MKAKGKIAEFRGKYAFLSNFATLPSGRTLEHYYQAEKTESLEWKFWIMEAPSAAIAKKRGRAAPMKKGWMEVRTKVMAELVLAKFRLHPPFRIKLLNTEGYVLEEGNNWGDTFWGTVDGEGENHLGKILMYARTVIKKEEKK